MAVETPQPMPDGLRVALFAESYLPYLSGVTISTAALARGLAAAGHRVLVVAPRSAANGHGPAEQVAGTYGIEHAWLPSYQLPAVVPRDYRMPWPLPSSALRRAIAFRPDVVHAHSPFVSGLMARGVAERLGTPLVFTHHTRFTDYRHYLGALAGPGAALIDRHLRRFWERCAAVVAPSSELAGEISARLAGARRAPVIRVIPTGLDLEALGALTREDPRRLAGWPAEALVVVSVGRLAPEKSVDVLVEALAQMPPVDRDVRLLLVGGGPSEAALRRRVRARDLAGRVHLTGVVPRERALSLLKGADLFAFASRTETQGLVLAEALASRLPVVALAGPGVADTVRHGEDGLVVDVPQGGAVAALAGAMASLLGDRARLERFASGAVDGSERFDRRVRVAEMVALYRETLAGPAPTAAGSTLTR